MNVTNRLNVARLTEAVFEPEDEDPLDEPRPEWKVRLLPSVQSMVLLGVVVLLVAGIGVWKTTTASSAKQMNDSGDYASTESAQSIQVASSAGQSASLPAPQQSIEQVTVYVTGAVNSPSLVTLEMGKRVADALEEAGGVAEDADVEQVNLARPLVDGEHIVIPRLGEVAHTPSDSSSPTASTTGSSCIDLNTADVGALEQLDGVGPALARRIKEFRDQSGPFQSVDDVDAVPGIGPALLEKIRSGACQ